MVDNVTPYQRCLATLAGEVPDRMPAYTPTIACDVASAILGRRVDAGGPSLWYAEARAWVAGETAHDEFVHAYVEALVDLNRRLDIEVFRFGWRKTDRPTRQLDEFTFLYGDPDGVRQVWRWDAEVGNYIPVLDTAPRIRPEDYPRLARERTRGAARAAEAARANAGAAEQAMQARLGESMFVAAGGGGIGVGQSEAGLMACLLEPGAVGDILDAQLEVGLAQMEGIAARGIKVVLGGGDMADKNGPLYSPRVFRHLILPRLAKLAARCRELGLHYVWRTDGRLWLVSDMIFREAGVPGYGEVDYDAGMEMAAIRQRYPELVVWANASGDRLRRGSAAEVYDHCRAILEGSGGRGYFHGCSNTVLGGTPVENVWAMMQARDDYRPQA